MFQFSVSSTNRHARRENPSCFHLSQYEAVLQGKPFHTKGSNKITKPKKKSILNIKFTFYYSTGRLNNRWYSHICGWLKRVVIYLSRKTARFVSVSVSSSLCLCNCLCVSVYDSLSCCVSFYLCLHVCLFLGGCFSLCSLSLFFSICCLFMWVDEWLDQSLYIFDSVFGSLSMSMWEVCLSVFMRLMVHMMTWIWDMCEDQWRLTSGKPLYPLYLVSTELVWQ